MSHTAGTTGVSYDAHVEYARRVEEGRVGRGGALPEANIASKQTVVREAADESGIISEWFAHFWDAGRPQTCAMYPEPHPELFTSELWTMTGVLQHVRPVKLWNNLSQRHPSILICLKMLRQVLSESATVWKGRHEMFGG